MRLKFWQKKALPTSRKLSRYYQAAKQNRLTTGWSTQTKSPDDIITESLPNLRGRSREQYANNDYMRRFVNLTKSNVIGPKGMRLQGRCVDQKGQLDKLDNDAIEKAFLDWGRRGNCDTSTTLSFPDIQRLLMSSVVIDGEFLAIETKSGPYGYRLQLIDPEALPVGHNVRPVNGGNYIKFSIEFTTSGEPVAYYFRSDAGGDGYSFNGIRYERVPASRVIHCFLPERIGQKRGIPVASTAMLRMNQLGGYEDAAITAARVGASKMGFFTRNAEGVGYEGDETDEEGALITDVEPGTFEELPEGVDFKTFNPDYPHAQFPEFVKACLRGISSGLGISYHTLANDLEGVNYTSSRTGALEDREEWKTIQEWVIESFHYRVYNNWLKSALSMGMIVNAAGFELPAKKIAKFREHSWQARRWSWVDPLKDTQANKIAIESGLKSRTEVIREQGRDPEQVWSELEAEQERLGDILLTVDEQVLLAEDQSNAENE